MFLVIITIYAYNTKIINIFAFFSLIKKKRNKIHKTFFEKQKLDIYFCPFLQT
jgi:hypothetical protein